MAYYSYNQDGVSITQNVKDTAKLVCDDATNGLEAIKNAINTVDGLVDVPTANATTNATIRDVAGNKTDDAVAAVTTNKSLMGYTKGILNAVSVPAADATTNVDVADVVGNKEDAAVATVTTNKSVMGYTKAVVNTVNSSTLGVAVIANALRKHTGAGILVSKSITLNGTGAQTDNLFSLAGTVYLKAIWGEVTEATNATTCTSTAFLLYDSTSTVDITKLSSGLSLSAVVVGSVFYKGAASTSNAILLGNAAGAVNEAGPDGLFLIKKTGAATFVQVGFTGDADTDIDVTFYAVYEPISADGALAAV